MSFGLSIHRSLRVVLSPLVLAGLLAGCAGNISRETYSNLAANLVSRGHLRTERAPADALYTSRDVIRNFRDIAFSYEFHFRNGRLINRRIDKPLNRWEGPVRYRLIGDGVTEADYATVARLSAELSELTGLRFERSDDAHNMLISIASATGRASISKQLSAMGRETYRNRYETWRDTPSWLCGATLSVDRKQPGLLAYAHIFMESELDGVMRQSCLHEEIVQSLGLTNDSDKARPSIFNDNQEFALLTDHDALLLRILYDERLTPGMNAHEAMPIVETITGAFFREGQLADNTRILP